MKDFFDFSQWAPKSSRIWRLNQVQYEDSTTSEPTEGAPGGSSRNIENTSASSITAHVMEYHTLQWCNFGFQRLHA